MTTCSNAQDSTPSAARETQIRDLRSIRDLTSETEASRSEELRERWAAELETIRAVLARIDEMRTPSMQLLDATFAIQTALVLISEWVDDRQSEPESPVTYQRLLESSPSFTGNRLQSPTTANER